MDWLDKLMDFYDTEVAPKVNSAVKWAGDFGSDVSNAVAGGGNWVQQNANDAGNWLQQQVPQMQTPQGGSGAGMAGQGATSSYELPQAASQGTTSSVGNWGSSSSGVMGGDYSGAQYNQTPGIMSQVQDGMDKVGSVMKKVEAFGARNAAPIGLATKLYAGFNAREAGNRREADMRQQVGQESANNAANNAITAKNNAVLENDYTDRMAQVGMAGMRAQRATDGRTQGALGKIAASNLSAAAKLSESRRALVEGRSAGVKDYNIADTAARNNVKTPSYAAYATPSSTAADQLSRQQYANNTDGTKYFADVADDIFGLSKPKTNAQVGY